MQVRISWNDWAGKKGSRHIGVTDAHDESMFWETVASQLKELPMPLKGEPNLNVTIEALDSSCQLVIEGRDAHIIDGRFVASPAIFPAPGSEDGIRGLHPSTYPERYLTFCSEQSTGGRGSYKFYRFIPNPDGTIGAEYGRIGQSTGFGSPRKIKKPYPSWMYHLKVAEKLMKGYRDESESYLGERIYAGAKSTRPNLSSLSASQKLFWLLSDAACSHASRELRFPGGVSAKQVSETRKTLYEMGRRKTVEGFNRQLMRLLQIAPRNLYAVSCALASSESDFARIIKREEDLLAAMQGIVASKKAKKISPSEAPSFSMLGVEVRLADKDERKLVLSHLSLRLRKKVREIYAVDCAKQTELFEDWIADRDISDVRMLWHGSPSGNWASIVENSLWVPTASSVAHGSMFGRGIYFGSIGAGGNADADGGGEKSWGYVGAGDSYWQRGELSVGSGDVYMALFDVAYGKPYHPTSSDCNIDQQRIDAAGCDCLHAERGACGLRNDEIVVYDERAVRIRYLVRFTA